MGTHGVVFDTNVFVSALGFDETPGEAILAASGQAFDVFVSPTIADEY